MASLKIHEQCQVGPPSAIAKHLSLPLTYFDLIMLKYEPIEQIFYYSLSPSHSDPYFFFDKIIPKLKTSLSCTLQHFLPLAGNIVWPSNSPKPFIQVNPNNDGVSFVVAQCDDANFNQILEYKLPREAIESRVFIPNLESNDSLASVISIQITLFPNSGFSIGISANHAALDGKSLTMFVKAWASLCKMEESSSLVPGLTPIFNREIIKDPTDLGLTHTNNFIDNLPHIFPIKKGSERSMKIVRFEPKLENSVRATFELTREDLDKMKKRVLNKWQVLDGEESKPLTLSSFVVTCAYVLVCIGKAIQGVYSDRDKFEFVLTVDCRARLEPPVPNNYFGNCVWGHFIDAQPLDFIKEGGLFYVAKSIYNKIKMINDEGVFAGKKEWAVEFTSYGSQGAELMLVFMSNQFGVYETDFGWGKPALVESVLVGKGLDFSLAEGRDGRGGVEIGLLLNTHVMDLFTTLFHEGLSNN